MIVAKTDVTTDVELGEIKIPAVLVAKELVFGELPEREEVDFVYLCDEIWQRLLDEKGARLYEGTIVVPSSSIPAQEAPEDPVEEVVAPAPAVWYMYKGQNVAAVFKGSELVYGALPNVAAVQNEEPAQQEVVPKRTYYYKGRQVYAAFKGADLLWQT